MLLHDGERMACFREGSSASFVIPGGDLEPLPPSQSNQHNWHTSLRAHAKRCWNQKAGPFSGPLSALFQQRMRRAVKLGHFYLLEVRAQQSLDELVPSLRHACALTTSRWAAHVVEMTQVSAEGDHATCRARLASQYGRYVSHCQRPQVDDGLSKADIEAKLAETLTTTDVSDATRAALLIRDQTHGVIVEGKRVGLTVPDIGIEVGQRPIDAALRALHLAVGPLVEHSISPALHAAVMRASEDPRVLTVHKGVVVLECRVDLERPLVDYRASLFASRLAKAREQPDRTAPIVSADIMSLAQVQTSGKCSPLLTLALRAGLADWPVQSLPPAPPDTTHQATESQTCCTRDSSTSSSAPPALLYLAFEALITQAPTPQTASCVKGNQHGAGIADLLTSADGTRRTLARDLDRASCVKGQQAATTPPARIAGGDAVPSGPMDTSKPPGRVSAGAQGVVDPPSSQAGDGGDTSGCGSRAATGPCTEGASTESSAASCSSGDVAGEQVAVQGCPEEHAVGIQGPFAAAPPEQRSVHEDDITDAPGTRVQSSLPTTDLIKKSQREDPFSRDVVSYHESGQSVDWLVENIDVGHRDKFVKKARDYRLVDGLLVFLDKWNADDAAEFQAGGKPRVYIPTVLRDAVMHAYHAATNHAGIKRTLALMSSWVWWPRMPRQVRRFCRHCHVCAMGKVPRHKAGEAHRVEDGEYPWDVIVIDLYTYQNVDGFDHVLVISDGFTRGVELVACRGTPTSKQVLDMLFDRVIRGHRTTPRFVRSDAGSIFISELCQEFWSAYGAELRWSTAEHHTTAGLAERVNATLHDFLITHRLASGDERWYLYLGHIENAFNALVNSTTGFSPTYAEFGREARLPLDVAFHGIHSGHRCVSDYVRSHLTALHSAWDVIRERLGLNALARKQERDTHVDTELRFEVHDRKFSY